MILGVAVSSGKYGKVQQLVIKGEGKAGRNSDSLDILWFSLGVC